MTAVNVLNGGGGNDTLYGFAGADTLNGGSENDVLDGGSGDDTLAGGTGDDSYVVDAAGDTVTELAGEGYDLVYARVDYTLAAGAEVEVLVTGWLDTNAAIDLTGNELGQQLWGNDAVNVLNGGGGNDILYGSAGADTLNGGSENEVLDGGSGDDTLAGGTGDDLYLVDAAGDSRDRGWRARALTSSMPGSTTRSPRAPRSRPCSPAGWIRTRRSTSPATSLASNCRPMTPPTGWTARAATIACAAMAAPTASFSPARSARAMSIR